MTLSRLALRALVIGVLVTAPALVTSSVTSESPCEALARWAEPYRGTSPSLDEMVRFDRARRIAIFNAVSPSVRAALWQEHLRRFAQREELSDEQRALIVEALALATAAFYERQAGAVQAFERVWPRIDRAFVGEQKRVWFDLGSSANVPNGLAAWNRVVQTFTVSAQVPSCHCNFWWQDCWTGVCADIACNELGSGCGPMNRYPCTGICQ